MGCEFSVVCAFFYGGAELAISNLVREFERNEGNDDSEKCESGSRGLSWFRGGTTKPKEDENLLMLALLFLC